MHWLTSIVDYYRDIGMHILDLSRTRGLIPCIDIDGLIRQPCNDRMDDNWCLVGIDFGSICLLFTLRNGRLKSKEGQLFYGSDE